MSARERLFSLRAKGEKSLRRRGRKRSRVALQSNRTAVRGRCGVPKCEPGPYTIHTQTYPRNSKHALGSTRSSSERRALMMIHLGRSTCPAISGPLRSSAWQVWGSEKVRNIAIHIQRARERDGKKEMERGRDGKSERERSGERKRCRERDIGR